MKRLLTAATLAGALLVPTLGAVDAHAGTVDQAGKNDLCIYKTDAAALCVDMEKMADFVEKLIHGASGFGVTL